MNLYETRDLHFHGTYQYDEARLRSFSAQFEQLSLAEEGAAGLHNLRVTQPLLQLQQLPEVVLCRQQEGAGRGGQIGS